MDIIVGSSRAGGLETLIKANHPSPHNVKVISISSATLDQITSSAKFAIDQSSSPIKQHSSLHHRRLLRSHTYAHQIHVLSGKKEDIPGTGVLGGPRVCCTTSDRKTQQHNHRNIQHKCHTNHLHHTTRRHTQME